MKKTINIIPGVAIVFWILGFLIGMMYNEKYGEKEPAGGDSTTTTTTTVAPTTDENTIKDVDTKLKLNVDQDINCLEKMNIEGTNDYFVITKKVVWKVPEHEEGETVSFAIAIPYTITVDGKEYQGTYSLNSSDNSTQNDENTKYNIKVTNLTSSGIVTINISNK